MKGLKLVIIIKLFLLLLLSCNNKCEETINGIDIKDYEEQLKNEFLVYKDTQEYYELQNNNPIKYENFLLPFEDSESFPEELSDAYKKAFNNYDSLIYHWNEKGDLEVNYFYFTKETPIIPQIVTSSNVSIVRCKRPATLSLLCHENKVVISQSTNSAISRYHLKILLTKEQIKQVNGVIFEPTGQKSFLILPNNI